MEVAGKDILVDRTFRPDIKSLFFIVKFTFFSGLQYVKAFRANLHHVFSFESLLYFMSNDMKKDLRVGLTEEYHCLQNISEEKDLKFQRPISLGAAPARASLGKVQANIVNLEQKRFKAIMQVDINEILTDKGPEFECDLDGLTEVFVRVKKCKKALN
eukprot:4668738-Amphidinium_carterae.1